jgi:muconate cycloisomerase
MTVREFELVIPDGPGYGVTVDETQLNRFDRARVGLNAVHVDMGKRTTSASKREA